jgi:hypothetical protein
MNELTINRQDELVNELVNEFIGYWVDAMDSDDLIEFFAETQLNHFNRLSIDQFIELAIEETALID